MIFQLLVCFWSKNAGLLSRISKVFRGWNTRLTNKPGQASSTGILMNAFCAYDYSVAFEQKFALLPRPFCHFIVAGDTNITRVPRSKFTFNRVCLARGPHRPSNLYLFRNIPTMSGSSLTGAPHSIPAPKVWIGCTILDICLIAGYWRGYRRTTTLRYGQPVCGQNRSVLKTRQQST